MMYRKGLSKLIAMVLVFCIMIPLFITTAVAETSSNAYYVSNSGSDENDGRSPATAWKTLENVNSTTFQPGDTILFEKGGIWTGPLYPKGSGTQGLPIKISSYGSADARPLIKGNGSIDGKNGNSPQSAAVYLYNQQY